MDNSMGRIPAKPPSPARARSKSASPPLPTMRGPTVIGAVEEYSNGHVTGWAINRINPLTPVELIVYVDGRRIDRVMPDQERGDLSAMGFPVSRVGFTYAVPREFHDGQEHRLQIHAPDGTVLLHQHGKGNPRVQHSFVLEHPSTVEGYLDDCIGGLVRGWAVRKIEAAVPGVPASLKGGVKVRITVNGHLAGQMRADLYRSDVARHLECDPNCGFEYMLPPEWRMETEAELRVFIEPDHYELPKSPIAIAFPPEDTVVRLMAVYESVERLHLEAERLRNEIRRLLPARSYSLVGYDIWARRYYPALRERVRLLRDRVPLPPGGGPLVSVLCPTYRPLMRDFEAAIASVRAQTYNNWELVIVDDGSKSAELSEYLDTIVAKEPRIRLVRARRNGGISNATNLAIAQARGEWFAFFDHDDLLVDVALEIMVGAALETGAEMLYSDEDKIDDAGRFLEPVFKPDWNYRLLLGINYVCHLLFVKRDSALRVGSLDPALDGAQDYDFILRLAASVPHDHIVHVPEILYHWRKTANSTASDISNKPDAIAAGRRAIEGHLQQLGFDVTVSTPSTTTLYTTRWTFTEEPLIRIVVPFKDQVETTCNCLGAILKLTRYENYEVVLVDNWSATLEAEHLIASALNHPRIHVLRIEEEFNYSRLNNIAASFDTGGRKPEFFVFMNNDVFVHQPLWLRILVDEALADLSVGAVGGKLLYPNGTVQHGGCILGLSGQAAGHVHTGAGVSDAGYLGRAALAQELSAVTAACVLVRTSAFSAAGGFDETELAIAFNDIDLCLKLRRNGHKVIFTPAFVAEHAESLSRGEDTTPRNARRFFHEGQVMIRRWGDLLWNDPAYNRHFELMRRPFHDLAEGSLDLGDPVSWIARRPNPRHSARVDESYGVVAGTSAGLSWPVQGGA